jgi:maleylacetoacetate isomerase
MQNLRLLDMIDTKYKGDKQEFATHWVTKGLGTLEEILKTSKGKYCFGDQITIADCYLIPQIQGAIMRFGIKIDDFPNIKAVHDNLKDLPAFEKAHPKNQPDFV